MERLNEMESSLSKGCLTITILELEIILRISASMSAGISIGEKMAMISLSFAFLMSFLWEELQGRFALFAFKFVFSGGKGQKIDGKRVMTGMSTKSRKE